MIRRPPRSPLFPYTPLSRSARFHRRLRASPDPAPPARRYRAVTLDQLLRDRKSTRLNSSHLVISYAVFCLKKKKQVPNQDSRLHAPRVEALVSDATARPARL